MYLVLTKEKTPIATVVLVPVNKAMVSDPSQPSRSAYTEIFRSGPQAGGRGADFSGWYEVAAAPPKEGFVIDPKQSAFELVGDRSCNAWSQCVVADSTDTALVWRFRMQSHNESLSNLGIAYSEGILKVTYVPKGH
jgi:hypothetical protein